QEAVAGMDGVGARVLGDADDLFDVQIALGRGRRADRVGLVGHLDVERVAIDVGENSDGRDAELATRAHDAHGDLAAIGDQDLGEAHSPNALIRASTNEVSTTSRSTIVAFMKPWRTHHVICFSRSSAGKRQLLAWKKPFSTSMKIGADEVSSRIPTRT